VLLGSTQKMGTGTNVQTRLVALHHGDAPWKPAEVEQRDGRILRCPFTHNMAQLPRYASNATLSFYASNRVTFSIGCKVCNSFPSMGVGGAN